MKLLQLARLCLVLPALVLLGLPARADFLDGRCVNAQNQGVAGVNIDAVDAGGNDITLFNDGTDVNGFFHVTIPAGTFTIIFKPPPPPASTSLQTEFGPVAVSGTTDIGTITLLQGIALTGHVVNPSNVGVPNVDLDIVDPATNEQLPVLNDNTDASGNFSVAAPTGPIELRFDPTPSGQALAPRYMLLNLAGNTNLGTIQLAQGFTVGAIVRNPSNNPVANVDVDVEVSATGEDLFTPGDNTNSSGFVDVVVPAGTFNFEFCPPFNTGLAGKLLTGVVVNGNLSLGIVTLQSGFVLSGHVQSHTSAPVQGATVRLFDAGTGAEVPLCNDHTDASGNYASIAPPGTFKVCFLPPNGAPLGASCMNNVVISGPTTVNGVLPAVFTSFCFGDGSLPTPCPCGNTGAAGHGCANSNAGSPGAQISVSGTTYPDTAVLTASDMRPTALSIFIQGSSEVPNGVFFGDGLRCTGGSLKRLVVKNAVGGTASFPVAVGELPIRQRSAQLGDVIPVGATRYYQTYYRDPAPSWCPNPPGSTFNITNGTKMIW